MPDSCEEDVIEYRRTIVKLVREGCRIARGIQIVEVIDFTW